MSLIAWLNSGWGLISMKVAWLSPAVAMAWLNRTGWRTLATQYLASNVAVPVSFTVEMNGTAGVLGARSANVAFNSGSIGSMVG